MGASYTTSSSSSSSTFYSSFSSSSTTNNGQGHHQSTGHRYTTNSLTSPDGTTTVRTVRQDMGQPVIVEEHRYDESGRELAALPDARSQGMRRIEDLDDQEEEDDEYEKV